MCLTNGFSIFLLIILATMPTTTILINVKTLALSGYSNNDISSSVTPADASKNDDHHSPIIFEKLPPKRSNKTYIPPIFDFGMPTDITTRSDQTAAITCRIERLGDKSVSWIRKRDLHILTAGIMTYTSDERFQVIHAADSNDWTLNVNYAQPRDSGIYECQVNTEPKMSMAFRLNVIVTPPEARAIILGPPDHYVKVGSVITLTCHVNQPAPHDVGPIHWYREHYRITPFALHPNDAVIDLSLRISMESKLGDILKSRLRIANAQTTDSANYSCVPATADPASVMVHVINDENPAAMQKSKAAIATRSHQRFWLNINTSLAHIICILFLVQLTTKFLLPSSSSSSS